jgi:thioredoxin 1
MSIFEVKNKEEYASLLKKNDNCIVDFYGEWCAPCMKLGGNLSKITDEVKNVVIVKVNVNDLDDIAERYEVTTIPHIIFYKKGKLMEKYLLSSDYEDVINLAKDLFTEI